MQGVLRADKHDLLLIIFAVPVILVVTFCVLPLTVKGRPLVSNGKFWIWLMAVWTICWTIGFIVADYRQRRN